MLTAEMWLQWHYLIFLLPLAVSALLLLLSSVRLGHHGHGVHGHGGHGAGHGAAHGSGHGAGHGAASQSGHGPAAGRGAGGGKSAPSHPAGRAHGGKADPARTAGDAARRAAFSPSGLLFSLLGVGRAPLPLVIEAFFLAWGFCGFFANELLLAHTPNPGLIRMLPSLSLALLGGLAGARLASEMMARLMPPEESLVVSRDGLFELTGAVTYPVSASSGRIHVYDEFGTLHDEMCRVLPGSPPIAKGCTVMVMDTDPQGLLIVEEIPARVR